jgi:hypothetical protein
VLSGPLIAVIDADDVLLPSYLSAHAQVHLCREIGLSSSRPIEIGGDGSLQTGTHDAFGGNDLSAKRGIAIDPETKRIDSLSPDQFVTLVANLIEISDEVERWQWAPGSANVYRKEVLRFSRPLYAGKVCRAAVDNYFVPFCNALSSSILIDLPLSAYRIHGSNRHAATNSMNGLRTISRAGERRSAERRRDIIVTLCSRPELFLRACDDRKFWRVMDLPSKIDRESIRTCYESQSVRDTLRTNFQKLCDAFGKSNFENELRKRMSAETFRSLLESVPTIS